MRAKETEKKLLHRVEWKDLDTDYLDQLIAFALREDNGGLGLKVAPKYQQDVSSQCWKSEKTGKANLVARTELTVCGIKMVPLILAHYHQDCTFKAVAEEGQLLQKADSIGSIEGPTRALLQAERVLLNFLQYLSGIATQTASYVDAMGTTTTRLLDTRKTTPCYRMLEKYAVACGKAWNHRLGLFDRVMLKDNHLAFLGAEGLSLIDAIKVVHQRYPELIIEVEVDHLSQINPLLDTPVDVILLDNFSTRDLQTAIQLIGNNAYTEASGQVTLDTLPELASLGLDFISSGALTHQSQWQDIGMDWVG